MDSRKQGVEADVNSLTTEMAGDSRKQGVEADVNSLITEMAGLLAESEGVDALRGLPYTTPKFVKLCDRYKRKDITPHQFVQSKSIRSMATRLYECPSKLAAFRQAMLLDWQLVDADDCDWELVDEGKL